MVSHPSHFLWPQDNSVARFRKRSRMEGRLRKVTLVSKSISRSRNLEGGASIFLSFFPSIGGWNTPHLPSLLFSFPSRRGLSARAASPPHLFSLPLVFFALFWVSLPSVLSHLLPVHFPPELGPHCSFFMFKSRRRAWVSFSLTFFTCHLFLLNIFFDSVCFFFFLLTSF